MRSFQEQDVNQYVLDKQHLLAESEAKAIGRLMTNQEIKVEVEKRV